MLVHRNTINISLFALRQMVTIAEMEAGRAKKDKNITVSINLGLQTIGLKEHYYAPTLSFHQFFVEEGNFGPESLKHNRIEKIEIK